MVISIRIDKELEGELERVARMQGLSKSGLIRRCLAEYLVRRTNRPTPWELGKDRFGKVGSGRSDLSTNRKKILREMLHARARRD